MWNILKETASNYYGKFLQLEFEWCFIFFSFYIYCDIINDIHDQIKHYAMLSRFSRVRLCDPIEGRPPGSIVPGILQARILEWVAISLSSSWKEKSESEVAQSCPSYFQ